MFSTVPSAMCATSKTAATTNGRPAESKRRTAYESPHPRATAWRTSSACELPNGGVAFGVAASGDGALATWLDGAGALGLGRAVALSLGRPPLAPWVVPAFGGAPVSLAGVLAPRGGVPVFLGEVVASLDVVPGSRDTVPVTSEGWLVSRFLGVSLSASRGEPDFGGAGPPGGAPLPPGPPESGCLVCSPASDTTTAVSATPIKIPRGFGIIVPDRRRWKRRGACADSCAW